MSIWEVPDMFRLIMDLLDDLSYALFSLTCKTNQQRCGLELQPQTLFGLLSAHGTIHLLDHYYGSRHLTLAKDGTFARTAAYHGNKACIVWLKRHGYPWTAPSITEHAFHAGRPFVHWLIMDMQGDWDRKTMEAVAFDGDLVLMQWLEGRGQTDGRKLLTREVFTRGVTAGSVECVEWLMKKLPRFGDVAWNIGIEMGHVHVLDWLHKEHIQWIPPIPVSCWCKNQETYQWLVDHGYIQPPV